MRETVLNQTADAQSPAGASINFIMDGPTGNMIHASVPAGQINRATVHSTVSEFWYILEGTGEIWRRNSTEERTVRLEKGTSIDIPVGTSFQYRNIGETPLKFICTSMPPWPGDSEATYVEGIWQPNAVFENE